MEQPDRIKQDESLEVDALSGATFPVSYSILSADALMNEVAAGYDIGQPVQCQLLRPGMNDSYTVVTNRGRYFARAGA